MGLSDISDRFVSVCLFTCHKSELMTHEEAMIIMFGIIKHLKKKIQDTSLNLSTLETAIMVKNISNNRLFVYSK